MAVEFEIQKAPSTTAFGGQTAARTPESASLSIRSGETPFGDVRSADLFDRIPVVAAVTDFNGRVMLANGSWSELLGHKAETILGRPLVNLVHPDHVAAFLAALNESARDSKSQSLDVPFQCRDGNYAWLCWKFRPDTQQRILLAIAWDISARKLDESAYERRAHVSSLRAEIWAPLHSGYSSRSILAAWAALLQRYLDAGEVGIWTVDEHQDQLHLQAIVGARSSIGEPYAGSSQALVETLADQVREVHASRASRVLADSGGATPPRIGPSQPTREKPTQSIVLIPLSCHDRGVGVVAVYFTRPAAAAEMIALEKAAGEMGAALAILNNLERLHDAKRTSDALLRSTPTAVCCLDAQYKVTLWNAAAERIFGWQAAEVLGHALPIVRNSECEVFRVCIEGAFAGKSTGRLETRAQTRTGALVDISLSVFALPSADGRIEGISMAVTDETDRKRAERRLSLLHSMGHALADANSGDQAVNSTFALLGTHFEWSYGEFWSVDAKSHTLQRAGSWHSSTASAVEFENGSRFWSGGEPTDLANRVVTRRQPIRLARFSAERGIDRAALAAHCGLDDAFGFPIFVDKEIAGIALFFSGEIAEPNEAFLACIANVAEQLGQFLARQRTCDILRTTEENLRQSEKMDSIGRLVGGVAHDFNNLLSVILGYGELVLNEVPKEGQAHDLLVEVVDAGKRAASLTRQLLAFCRKEIYNPVVLDLNAHVEGMEKMMRRLTGEAIELTTTLAGDLGHIHADPAQIEQIVMNLVVNARDAMPQGGRIAIETQNVELSRSQSHGFPKAQAGSYVMLSVRDTGCGMDEATRVRIFEPFFTTKGVGKGTGMGLATVHEIVERCRGHIAVESQPGEGTTFQILFPPVASGLSAWEVDTAPQAIPQGTESVLVVDDDVRVRRLIGRLLQVQHYRVIEASDAAEAIKLCQAQPGRIDLVVTDVVMPDMNGPELAKRIQAKDSRVKVLFVSGYRDTELERLGLPDLSAQLLQKPFTTLDLAAKVREVLDAGTV